MPLDDLRLGKFYITYFMFSWNTHVIKIVSKQRKARNIHKLILPKPDNDSTEKTSRLYFENRR